jgi:hypothetical protein
VLLLLFVDLVEVHPSGSIGCFPCADSALPSSTERSDPVALKSVVPPE